MPTASLPAVTDPQGQQLATPVEIGPLQLSVCRMQLTESRQAGEQIRRTTQDFLQFFGGIGRDLTAKTTGSHIQEHLPANFA
ncbi:hypothetical protein D3C80_1147920 [compost metagenome]